MRKTAHWMVHLDERILEILREESWSSPKIIQSRLAFEASESRIRERCRILADAELIAFICRDSVEITNWGQLYLQGQIDAQNQPSPTKRSLIS